MHDALLGFERNITHMDGRQVNVKRDGVTQPGFVTVVDDEGMPVHGTMVSHDLDHADQSGRDMLFGKLYLEWQVVLPEKVDKRLQQSKFGSLVIASSLRH